MNPAAELKVEAARRLAAKLELVATLAAEAWDIPGLSPADRSALCALKAAVTDSLRRCRATLQGGLDG